ncbi:TPA: hypothetical protein J1246_004937 [Escherichia coli]|nr:hypothetical protein [Escherichia coli]EGN6573549.1 hypothetical protein [Escherichia coli]EHM4546637.1 hypothetical protein [Escherichia coli]EHM4803075.1 hypothetical protein [Escherichia coli]EIP3720034.1 hypothetical protein [Escherichia coli]
MATDNRSLMSCAHQKAFSLAAQLPPETIKACRELTELCIAGEISLKQLHSLLAEAATDELSSVDVMTEELEFRIRSILTGKV